jgi:hypothetical protein
MTQHNAAQMVTASHCSGAAAGAAIATARAREPTSPFVDRTAAKADNHDVPSLDRKAQMKPLVATLTALALLWHTLFGCCTCQACAPADRHEHAAQATCCHNHRHDGSTEHAHQQPVHDDSLPPLPGHHGSDGGSCVFAAGKDTSADDWRPAAWPDGAVAWLAPPADAQAASVATGRSTEGAQGAVLLRPALPLRAHLFYQLLLI